MFLVKNAHHTQTWSSWDSCPKNFRISITPYITVPHILSYLCTWSQAGILGVAGTVDPKVKKSTWNIEKTWRRTWSTWSSLLEVISCKPGIIEHTFMRFSAADSAAKFRRRLLPSTATSVTAFYLHSVMLNIGRLWWSFVLRHRPKNFCLRCGELQWER